MEMTELKLRVIKLIKNPEPGALFITEQGAGGHDGHYGHVAVVIGVK